MTKPARGKRLETGWRFSCLQVRILNMQPELKYSFNTVAQSKLRLRSNRKSEVRIGCITVCWSIT